MLRLGDCLEVLRGLEADSIDSMVTDPPAGISFMGKEWDKSDGFIPFMTDVMKESLRVLKPGAHAFVWAIPRTSHWTATALEGAGFEIRDIVTHVFGSGFPKSHSIEKATADARFRGIGTALKPASEHWILVRKPCSEKTVAANVLKHRTGGLNIDASRIGTDTISTHGGGDKMSGMKGNGNSGVGTYQSHVGRFPANLILSHNEDCGDACTQGCAVAALKEPARFFYCAKTSKRERNEGCETNAHPTVKPIKLMSYLITLVTPPGGTVLDPFMGSGSTGVAAIQSGFNFLGIEKEPEYFQIAEKRIYHALPEFKKDIAK